MTRLAMFDCDGTLLDSHYAITRAMAMAFQANNRTPPPESAVRRQIGLSLRQCIARLSPHEDAAIIAHIASAYQDAWHDCLSKNSAEQLFAGAKETLAALAGQGMLLGIATGKGSRGLNAVLRDHDLSACFVTLQTADTARSKPDPDMLHRAMAETGVSNEHTVMIGDTSFDMVMARQAKVAAIGVSWGYHPAHALHEAGAATVIDAFSKLPAWIDRLIPQGQKS